VCVSSPFIPAPFPPAGVSDLTYLTQKELAQLDAVLTQLLRCPVTLSLSGKDGARSAAALRAVDIPTLQHKSANFVLQGPSQRYEATLQPPARPFIKARRQRLIA
jgi:hypothetical protein